MSLLDNKLPKLPYKKEYLDILEDINEEQVTYADVQAPMTSTDKYHPKVILEGIIIKRQNQELKENIISLELSMNTIATHAQDELLRVVCVSH